MEECNRLKTALITGGGSGIGRAIAIKLAQTGYTIAVNDIDPEAGQQALNDVEKTGAKGSFFKADVSDSQQVRKMFDGIDEKWGQLDVLVNNAGAPGAFSLLSELSDETWHKTIGVHLNGTFYCLRNAARTMIQAGHGRIINIASIAGLVGTIGSGEYSAAKAGVINLTKTAAKEMAPFGITINAIAPGIVATPINLALQKKNSAFIQAAIESALTGQMTTPEEIAELVLFLVSSAAKNLTGQVVTIDGAASTTMVMDRFMHGMVSKSSP